MKTARCLPEVRRRHFTVVGKGDWNDYDPRTDENKNQEISCNYFYLISL